MKAARAPMRIIPRAVFFGLGGWFILSVPLIFVMDGDIRAILWKHEVSDFLFREFVKDAAKALGTGTALLFLAFLLGRANPVGVALALAANAGLLFMIWKDGTDGKDLVVIVPLVVSMICLGFEGCRTVLNLKRRTT